MLEEKSLPAVETRSKKAILTATGIAMLVALLILFTAVLPAEYGIDPLKTGAALGLTGLSKAADKMKSMEGEDQDLDDLRDQLRRLQRCAR